MMLKPQLPKNVAGLDIESKATDLLAYILTTGVVNISLEKFTITEILSMEMDSEDPKAVELFSSSESTISWWENTEEGNPFKPSKLAKEISWGGSVPHYAGITKTVNVLNGISKVGTILTSRGPEFDYRILEQAAIAYGLTLNYRYSNLDSDRTYERMGKAMGIPAPTDEEMAKWKIKNIVRHTAVFDAALEAYNAARMLWLGAIAATSTPEELKVAVEEFANGTFDTAKYLDKVDFYG